MSEPNWTDIVSAISTAIIGLIGVYIAIRQYQIEKHKKDDFLYEKRFDFYNELNVVILSIINEIMKLHKKEISEISMDFIRPIMVDIFKLKSSAPLLFNNENINICLDEVIESIKIIFSEHNDDSFKNAYYSLDQQQLKIPNLFKCYLNLGE